MLNPIGPLSEVDDSNVLKNNADTQTNLQDSYGKLNNNQTSHLHNGAQNSLQLSNSASVRDPSLLAMPMNSKISSGETTPFN